MNNKYSRYALFFLLIVDLSCSPAQKNKCAYNFSFECLDDFRLPIHWKFNYTGLSNNSKINVDSQVTYNGKYSICITGYKSNAVFGICSYKMPGIYKGSIISLSGYIKSSRVAGGHGGLWMRLDSHTSEVIAIDKMENKGVTGTTNWQKYTIQLPYDSIAVKDINFGAYLNGYGKIWVDNLNITIDGIPVSRASQKGFCSLPAYKDTFFSSKSNVTFPKLNSYMIERLTTVGLIWGFLKYHSMKVSEGEYNWDAMLFRTLPHLINSNSKKEFDNLMFYYLNRLYDSSARNANLHLSDLKVKYQPNYWSLFSPNKFPASIIKLLYNIKNTYYYIPTNYYVGSIGTNRPFFRNELSYEYDTYPDAGIRLLTLYRYWNMVNYYYPYRHLLNRWDNVLEKFIPKFIGARNSKEYTLACLELICELKDTHANIWSDCPDLDTLKGKYFSPYQAKFINGKLIIISCLLDSNNSKDYIGDQIVKIDSKPIGAILKKYLFLTPASNYSTQLRDICSTNGFLFRTNNSTIKIDAIHNGKVKHANLPTISLASANIAINNITAHGYSVIADSIGYIYAAKLNDSDINLIKPKFKNTKGIIIDLRNYPSTFMPYTYGNWLKAQRSPFALRACIDINEPGQIIWDGELSNGGDYGEYGDYYIGKILILVNEHTQSQGEFTAMALGSCPNALVVGSTTAGADGDVLVIELPGGLKTMISGIGIYYPDRKETQRIGIKINKYMTPTIKGIAAGKDELLEQAISIINK